MIMATPPPLGIPRSVYQTVALCVVFNILATITVILRIRARIIKKKRLQFNDYTIFIALFFSICLAVIVCLGSLWGYSGYHMSEINPIYRGRIFLLFTAGQPVWGAANTAVKFSVRHLYLTIFPSQIFHRVCYTTMAASFAYLLSVILETFVLCRPVQYNWDRTIHGTCDKNTMVAYILSGSGNLILDIIVVVLPMRGLWNLRLPWGKKIGIMAMFGLGAFICVISLLRVIVISRLNLADFTYATVPIGIWSILEPALGVVNASLPILRPIFKDMSKSRAFRWALSVTKGLIGQKSGGNLTPSGQDIISLGKSANQHQKPEKPANSMDQLYPLDTVNLVGDEHHGNMGV